jgi:hypothetical protein
MKTSSLSKLLRISLSTLLVLTQLGLAGCGKEPMKPSASTLRAKGGAGSQSIARMPTDDDFGPRLGGPGFAPPTWHGGPGSLPTGPGITPQELLAHVDSLEAVQHAKAEFQSRGYIRRADLDSLCIQGKASTVLLGYQKPGLELNQAEAYIFVVTRRVDQLVAAEIGDADNPGVFHEGYVPVTLWQTQVGGGLIGHSHSDPDTIVYLDTPEDPSLLIVGQLNDAHAPSWSGTTGSVVLTGLGTKIDFYDFITVWDMYGYNFNQPAQPDATWTYYPYHDDAYWADIAHNNRTWVQALGEFAIVASTTSVIFVAGAALAGIPISFLTIRAAIVTGMISGAGSLGASYWWDSHRP